MVLFKRRHIDVDADRRRNTRIELHIPVVILGMDVKAQIVDFSLDGFHIEINSHDELPIGQPINLALRLPAEKDPLRLKAKVIYRDRRGFGCRFTDLSTSALERLQRCFNVFNATLPIE
jgi:PilZ domain